MLGNGIRVCCLIFEEEFFLFFQTTGCCPFNVWFRRLWTDKSSPTRPFFSREFASSSFSRLLHWTNTSILGDGSPRASGLPYAGVAATRVVRERHEMCRGFPLTANTPYREPWNCFCKSAIAENTPSLCPGRTCHTGAERESWVCCFQSCTLSLDFEEKTNIAAEHRRFTATP